MRNMAYGLRKSPTYPNLITGLVVFIMTLLIVDALTDSIQIAFPIAIILATTPTLFFKKRLESNRKQFEDLWPEVLDLIISGVQSGLSLSQTLITLSHRGPVRVQDSFYRFSENVRSGISFEVSLSKLKAEFSHPLSDQVCEVLKIAHTSGSRDTTLTLRTFAEFVSSDLALNEEIRAKHSWIRNSALLASVTPWILLVLLSTQENARAAYSSTSGLAVLSTGVFLTITAYLWMNKVGKVVSAPRVFSK